MFYYGLYYNVSRVTQTLLTKWVWYGCNECLTDVDERHLFLLLESGRQPVKTFVETVAGGGAASLDVPLTVAKAVEAKFVGHFSGTHSVGEVLLVGEDKEDGITELILIKHAVHLVASGVDTVPIVGVNHEDKTLCVLVVVSPERANLILASDVPHSERNVLVFDGLDVETDGGDGGDNFTELELVKDGSFTGSIEANHENSHLLLAKHALPNPAECETHCI